MHIVCFDVPYPPYYGGVIDVFNRIRALHQQQVKIHLHCFEYGRGQQEELNKYCEEVNYYKRKVVGKIASGLPYIVRSRSNENLLRNLLKDNYPVLMEGIHCTYFLYSGELRNRTVIVRPHNVEYLYYRALAKSEDTFYKKTYFILESRLLKKYERKIARQTMLLCTTKQDKLTCEKEFNAEHIEYMPAFIPYHAVNSKEGKGNFCLYHGNLSVSENEKAAIWLAGIFLHLDIPLIIAGKQPSEKLKRSVADNSNVSVLIDPTDEVMNDIVSNAHINILPSFNVTGIKIKLLNALFNGRFCLVNTNTVAGTDLGSLCSIADDPGEMRDEINRLIQTPFTSAEIAERKKVLEKEYNNELNAKQLMKWIY